MNIEERRKQAKAESDAYREAARKLLGAIPTAANVAVYAHVQQDADLTGAFVECQIWVPREEIQ